MKLSGSSLGEHAFSIPKKAVQIGLPLPYLHAIRTDTLKSPPDQMADRKPVGKGVTSSCDVGLRKRDEHFALKFEGLIDVPADGLYEFFTESDDGSALYVDGRQVVDNNALQGMTERSGQIPLQKGLHQFEVRYFNATGGLGLAGRWSGPQTSKATIPPSVLKHKP